MKCLKNFNAFHATLGLSALLSWLLNISHIHDVQTEELTLGAVLPENSFHMRDYRRTFYDSIQESDRNGKFYLKNHELKDNIIFMDKYSPPEILNKLCSETFEQKSTTIIYMSNKDFDGDTTTSAHYLIQTANYLGIPIIAWNGDNAALFQPRTDSLLVQIAPPISYQAYAMLSLLKRYTWHDFSIVVGSLAGKTNFISAIREALDQPMNQFKILSTVDIPLTGAEEKDNKAIHEAMRKLKDSETRVILMYTSRKDAESIMPIAKEYGLTSKEFIWVVCQNIVAHITKRDSDEKQSSFPSGMFGVYYDTDVESLKAAMKKAVAIWANALENMINDMDTNSQMKNLTLVPELSCDLSKVKPWETGRVLHEYIRKVKIDDPPLEFSESGNIIDAHYKIVNLDAEEKWQFKGTWSPSSGIHIDDIAWPSNEATPPKGRPAKYHIKVVTLQEKPYVIYSDPDDLTGRCPTQSVKCKVGAEDPPEGGYVNGSANSTVDKCCSGFCIDLLKMLSDKISFDFELFEVEDKKFGAFDADKGEWNGLVRTVMDGKADMCMTSLSITPIRSSVIDFSVPFLETGITIIVAVRDGVISPTAFLEPFDIFSWIFILLMCIHVVAVTIFIYEWLSPKGFNMQKMTVTPKGTKQEEERLGVFSHSVVIQGKYDYL